MKMQKLYILLLIFVTLSSSLKAQLDPHFSQFNYVPLQLNPSLAGVFNGSWRAGVNYRSQWASILENNPFRTVGLNYDQKIQVSRDDNMGIAVDLLQDQAGPANFNQVKGHLGMSYSKKVNGAGKRNRYKRGRNDQYISAGFQLGAGQLNVTPGNLWFSTQYDDKNVAVDYNAPNQEVFGNYVASNVFLDVNAGLSWYAIFDENKSVYVGGSLFHANAPSIRFNQTTGGDILRWRWVGQVGAELPFSDALSILPAFVIQNQGVAQEFFTGANIRYNARDWREVAIRTGLWSRFSNHQEKGKHLDALVITSVLEMEKLNIGLSYDINVSNLNRATNYRGAFELSLQYIQPQGRRKAHIKCPRF